MTNVSQTPKLQSTKQETKVATSSADRQLLVTVFNDIGAGGEVLSASNDQTFLDEHQQLNNSLSSLNFDDSQPVDIQFEDQNQTPAWSTSTTSASSARKVQIEGLASLQNQMKNQFETLLNLRSTQVPASQSHHSLSPFVVSLHHKLSKIECEIDKSLLEIKIDQIVNETLCEILKKK